MSELDQVKRERDAALLRYSRFEETIREMLYDGMSLAEWYNNHCAASQVAEYWRAKARKLEAELSDLRKSNV